VGRGTIDCIDLPFMSLPKFKYHPDPVGTGHIEESDTECVCCGQARGYIYVGPVFAQDELDDSICPWCIQDGSAYEEFNASFTDEDGFTTAEGEPADLPEEVVDEVAHRTPGFTGWQQERWLACCDDAAAFIGQAGHAELKSKYRDAIPGLRAESGLDDEEWESFYQSLTKEGSPTAYVFRCLHCRQYLAYADSD
jgi:uncharacterized protein CbrC (UPF0167 family)